MVTLKKSKPIEKIAKGDTLKVDGKVYEVDAHYVLIEHPNNKEMAIELFDPKTDADYQIRYFNDQVEETIDFYELVQGIMYEKKVVKKIEW